MGSESYCAIIHYNRHGERLALGPEIEILLILKRLDRLCSIIVNHCYLILETENFVFTYCAVNSASPGI